MSLLPRPRLPEFHTRVLTALLLLVPVACSATQPQHASADDLASKCSTSAPRRPNTEFVPSRHGFLFVNSFTGSPLPQIFKDPGFPITRRIGRWLHTHIPMPESFGLCGGMSAAAADLFYGELQPPALSTPPADGEYWYRYLQSRQMDSLGPAIIMAAKFAQWMHLPNDGPNATSDGGPTGDPNESAQGSSNDRILGTHDLTALEIPRLVARLARGDLVPLGLVKVRAGHGALWNNHQVLAFRAARPSADTVEFAIYDPNYPGDDRHTIRVSGLPAATQAQLDHVLPAEPAHAPAHATPAETSSPARVRINQHPGPRLHPDTAQPIRPRSFSLRGIFAMPYKPRLPDPHPDLKPEPKQALTPQP
jgi:hypothetical protein